MLLLWKALNFFSWHFLRYLLLLCLHLAQGHFHFGELSLHSSTITMNVRLGHGHLGEPLSGQLVQDQLPLIFTVDAGL